MDVEAFLSACSGCARVGLDACNFAACLLQLEKSGATATAKVEHAAGAIGWCCDIREHHLCGGIEHAALVEGPGELDAQALAEGERFFGGWCGLLACGVGVVLSKVVERADLRGCWARREEAKVARIAPLEGVGLWNVRAAPIARNGEPGASGW